MLITGVNCSFKRESEGKVIERVMFPRDAGNALANGNDGGSCCLLGEPGKTDSDMINGNTI